MHKKLFKMISKGTTTVLLILIISIFLRFYHLMYQSLWVDELHTLNECDPGLTWIEFINSLFHKEPHPPLYFIIIRLLFGFFVYDELIARAFSAIVGVLAIISIYFLGKELKNNRVGLISACISAVNFFEIQYSQEARGYTLVMLFSILSFLYFIRLAKVNSIKNSVLFGIFTISLIYTHYYGIFVFASQLLILIFYFFKYRSSKSVNWNYFFLPIFVIGCSYLFWIPFLMSSSFLNEFWIEEIPSGFAFDYFKEYFGDTIYLYGVFLLAILFSIYKGIKLRLKSSDFNVEADHVWILLIWICTVFLSGYFLSVFVRPSLISRYTIVVLPAVILLISIAFEQIPNRRISILVLSYVTIFSLWDLFINKKYYTTYHKTQFDKLTEFIIDSKLDYPVINTRTGWHQEYYFRKVNSTIPLVQMKGGLDAVLAHEKFKSTPGVWLIGAHNEPELTEAQKIKIDSFFTELERRVYYDCTARLFVSKREGNNKTIVLNSANSSNQEAYKLNNNEYLALWSNKPVTFDLNLDSGIYQIWVTGLGTAVSEEYPIIKVNLSDSNGTEIHFSEKETTYRLHNQIMQKGVYQLKLQMINDYYDKSSRQDRNAFIRSILIQKDSSRVKN